MKSNFEFLSQDIDTTTLYEAARKIERMYGMGEYAVVTFEIRKVIEQVAKSVVDFAYIDMPARATFSDFLREIKNAKLMPKDVLDLFYDLKNKGNLAAHEMGEYSRNQGLTNLHNFYKLMVWFAQSYTDLKPNIKAFKEPQPEARYNAFEKKLIYVQTIDGDPKKWPAYVGSEKIGDATIDDPETDNTPNSQDLKSAAEKRIRQYMVTAGIPFKVEWAELAYRKSDRSYFRDYDVHEVLERSGIKRNPDLAGGREWFMTDLETSKAAIKAVKEGRQALDVLPKPEKERHTKIVLRPEQAKAVKTTKKAFKSKDTMLWNAKMRFGKTLTALQLIKDQAYNKVLIMTHRPVVSDSWFEDFRKMGMDEEGYIYGSKDTGESIAYLKTSQKPFVYFASIQDLRGSEIFGGKAGDKNREFVEINWDLVIIDEAHEGTQTQLAQNVIKGVKKKGTKLLELSGTPFNLLDQYEEDQVYTWDYVMEQEAKYDWEKKNPDKLNPYASLPKVSMYTFDIADQFRSQNYTDLLDKAFNFKEFFKVDEEGQFVHKHDVFQFLNNLTTPDEDNNYPYSTKEFRNKLRHTLWILPGVKEANALEKMMKKHPVFGFEYNLVNVVKNDESDNIEISNESDLKQVRDAIGPDPAASRTITLTVRKLTTGVNVPEWTGVMFLSNTNSAMQYLQAAFRAQTPFTNEKLGRKTECFIFDFAPDRALTVMAESSRLNTGVGKRTSAVQKEQMAKLLNFMPIIGKSGNQMKRYEVDTLLQKIKRVYAEKAVKTGFDDDSLYSDELLMLDQADLKEFSNLKALVGTTQKGLPPKIDINNQGLSDEEYEDAERGKKKNPRERTEAEKAAMEKMKELKKQRKTMISILRSISIRIPMMIYGMDIDIKDDVNLTKFVKLVDDISWQEFMPSGVTKELFMSFAKYYDQEVFIEAGRIIRRRVKKLDELDPIQRADELATIFGTFRNPDKETVLTPWRVVNMQIGKTLGGYSFYDEDYKSTTLDGKNAAHWVQTEYTDKAFNPDTHILEINAKTGLYPLYAAISLYYQGFERLNEENAGKFTAEDDLLLWKRILRENIFVIAKTPMAKAITKRTLAGYQDLDTNVEYVENIVEDSKIGIRDEVTKIKGRFNNMKFDVVIGNPPYQESATEGATRAEPIYNRFMDLSYELAPIVTLITPGRFLFNAGQTPKKWNEKMLSDKHLKVVQYVSKSDDVFPRTDIKGGIAITLRDDNKIIGPIGVFTQFDELNSLVKKVWLNSEQLRLDEVISSRGNYRFSPKFFEDYPEARDRLGKGTGNMIVSNSFEKLSNVFNEEKLNDGEEYFKLIGRLNNERVYRYIRSDYVLKNDFIRKYNVLVPKANGSGAIGEVLSSPLIGAPLIGATDTFISIGKLDTEFEANSLLKYVKGKFLRALLGVKKVTQDNPKSVWHEIPFQNFTPNSDIDWSKSIPEIDQQLYKKYGLSKEEIDFIETKVQEMK